MQSQNNKMKKPLQFNKEAYENTASEYNQHATALNKAVQAYNELCGVLQADEAESFRQNPLNFTKEKLQAKAILPNASFEFNLEASGLNLMWHDLEAAVFRNEDIFRLNLYEFYANGFRVSEKALDTLKESCTIYLNEVTEPLYNYFKGLADQMNKGIGLKLLNEYARPQIIRAIPFLQIQVNEQGKYEIGVNTNYIAHNYNV